MALSNGMPDVERARHQEVSVSRRMGKNSIQLAAFTDRVTNLVLTGAGDPTSYFLMMCCPTFIRAHSLMRSTDSQHHGHAAGDRTENL